MGWALEQGYPAQSGGRLQAEEGWLLVPPARILVYCNRELGQEEAGAAEENSHRDTLLLCRSSGHMCPLGPLGPLSVMPSSVCSACIAITTSTFQSLPLTRSHYPALLPYCVKAHWARAWIQEKDLEVRLEVEKKDP